MRKILMFVVAVVVGGGCTGPEEPPDEASPLPALSATEVASFGALDGPAEYLFGDVTSVAVGPGPVVYVADRIGSTVRAYTIEGRFLGRVAGEGEGPGELQWPNDIAFDSQGRMYVRDARRITVFARRAGGAWADSVERTVPLVGYGNLSSTRARTDGQRYFYPAYHFPSQDEGDRYFYLVYDSTGHTGDTVDVPSATNLDNLRSAFYRVSRSSGRMVSGLNLAPFEPGPSWDLLPSGSVVTSDGEAAEIVRWTPAGDTAEVYRVEVGGGPVGDDEWNDSLAAFRARLDSVPVPVAEVQGMSPAARAAELPRTRPRVLALHAGPDGTVWARVWPSRPGTSEFQIVGSGSSAEARVILPVDIQADPPPFVSREFVVGVVRDPATEVERVVVFRLSAAEGG